MSTHLSPLRSRALPVQLPARPQLSLVPRTAAARASRVPFAVLVVVLLTVGLVGLLLLNTSLQRGAYVQTDLQERADLLARQEQSLELAVQSKSDPQQIAEEATRLGMVQSTSPAFLTLQGKVSGDPAAGIAGNTFLERRSTDQKVTKRGPHKLDAVTGTSGPVTVEQQKPAGETGTKPGDTRGTSDDQGAGRDTKNSDHESRH